MSQYTKKCTFRKEGNQVKTEMYERIEILQVNRVISEKVADYAKRIVDRILLEMPEAEQEKLEMFITHLAMAGKRAEEGAEENPIDEAILQGVKEEEAYEQAIVLRDQFLSMTDIKFPETEKDFLSVHLCNLLS